MKKLRLSAVGLLLVAIILGITLLNAALDMPFRQGKSVSQENRDTFTLNHWSYAWGEESSREIPKDWHPMDQTWNPPNRNNHKVLWLCADMPEAIGADPVLLLQAHYSFEVYVQNSMIYQFEHLLSNGKPKYIGTPERLIPLPTNALGHVVFIRIYSDDSSIGLLEKPVVADYSDAVLSLIRKQGGRLILGSLYMLIGLIMLYPYVKLRQKHILSFVGLAISFGLYTISRTTMVYLFLDRPLFWNSIEFLALTTTVTSAILFSEQIFGGKNSKYIRRLWQLHAAIGVLVLVLNDMDLVNMLAVLRIYQYLLLATIPAVLVYMIRKAHIGDRDARMVLLGTVIFSTCGVIDILNHLMFLDRMFPQLSYGGMAVLLSILLLIIIRRLVEMSSRLSQSDKLSLAGQLAAGVAHEIRNPVTVISGYLQLMKVNNPPSDHATHKRMIEIMMSEVNRIQLIMTEFLFLAKPSEPNFSMYAMEELLQDVLMLFESQAASNGVNITLNCPEPLPQVRCDANQMKQVFVNVVKNALEAMPEGGKLWIAAEKEEGWIVVTCRDSGVGMSEEEVARIGEPFYTTKETGNGLGVMICRSIIENHKGTWKLSSCLDVGTTIEIRLPI